MFVNRGFRLYILLFFLLSILIYLFGCIEKGSVWRCGNDYDCPSNAVCQSGTCVPICHTDQDCNNGMVCSDNGICVNESNESDGDKESVGSEVDKDNVDLLDDYEVSDFQDLEKETIEDSDLSDEELVVDAEVVDEAPIPDRDFDGIPDSIDNCPGTPNPNQLDEDSDGVGNVCDNCVFAANTDQQDTDNDNVGDICDPTPNSPFECALVECHPFLSNVPNNCPDFGLECRHFSINPGFCTKDCQQNTDCPAPYICVNGECSCPAAPDACPQNECSKKEDCWNMGYPQDARCLLPQGQCSMPCDGAGADFCSNFFNSSKYQCTPIAGYGSWCICSD